MTPDKTEMKPAHICPEHDNREIYPGSAEMELCTCAPGELTDKTEELKPSDVVELVMGLFKLRYNDPAGAEPFINILENAGLEITRPEPKEAWQDIAEFCKEANEGWCWIVHNGRTVLAWRDHKGWFRFNNIVSDCYMTEFITFAMAWDAPEPPKEPQ